MAQRHRPADVPTPTKEELRAQAHSERQRIHAELQDVAQQVSAGTDPEDVHEPGAAWKPAHRRDGEVARQLDAKRRRPLRHWKLKMWKRRSAVRSLRNQRLRSENVGPA